MKCPKCGTHISPFNLKTNCGNCGVNIYIYTREQEMSRDAKKAELEFASARMVIAKVKASFIGGKLQIARLISLFLILFSAFVPFSTMTISFPIKDIDISVGLLGALNIYLDGVYCVLASLLGFEMTALAMKYMLVQIILFLSIVIVSLVLFGVYVLSFLDIQKTAKVLCGFGVADIVLAAATFISAVVLKSKSTEFLNTKVSLGFGVVTFIAAVVIWIAVNALIIKKNVQPIYKENDPERKEILKKLKKGEIDIDDLPLPVVESEKEKEERINALLRAIEEEKKGEY